MQETYIRPTVGRIVHYTAYGTPGGEFPAGAIRAAVITNVHGIRGGQGGDTQPDDGVQFLDLCVLNPTGMFFNQRVPQGRGPGMWDWPERV